MCRVLSYIGEPILMEDLIYKPSNSLIDQALNPKFMFHYKNLCGNGFIAWDKKNRPDETPIHYKTAELPFFDRNLLNLVQHIKADCAIAHVRGGGSNQNAITIDSNAHPFLFPKAPVAMAHNGTLHNLVDIKADLAEFMDRRWLASMRGTTDTEWIYGTLLTHLCRKQRTKLRALDVVDALQDTFHTIKKMRDKKGIRTPSPVNTFISNGDFIVIARFVYDFGNYSRSLRESHLRYHTLWYTYGQRFIEGKDGAEFHMQPGAPKSIICSSEPLTLDTTGWVEVPEYSIMAIHRESGKKLKLHIEDITI